MLCTAYIHQPAPERAHRTPLVSRIGNTCVGGRPGTLYKAIDCSPKGLSKQYVEARDYPEPARVDQWI